MAHFSEISEMIQSQYSREKKYLFSKVITLTGKTKHFLNFIQKYIKKKYIDQYGLPKHIFNMVNIRNKLFEYKYL